MRALLLALAAPLTAMSVAVSPAAALDPPTDKFAAASIPASASGVTIHHGVPPGFERGFRGDRRGRDGDRRRRRGDGSILVYDRDYQGDTAWRSSSYNDWWHERPDRAYPRWMANNQNCERMWWSGGGWRC